MYLSLEEVTQWRLDPVTQEVLARAEAEVTESMQSIMDGGLLSDSVDRIAINTAHAGGYIEGLNWLLTFKGDPEDEKPQANTEAFTHTDEQGD